MKKLLLAALALLLILPAGLFGQSAAGGGRKTYTVNVSSNVPGAQVFLNGKSQGAAPLSLKLGAGGYDLLVKADGYADFAQRLDVKGDATVYAELTPLAAAGAAKLTVRLASVRIMNARVAVDGAAKGLVSGPKPLGIDLPLGSHTVIVELEGYASFVGVIDFKKAAELVVDLKPGATIAFALPAAVPGAAFAIDGKAYGIGSGSKPLVVGLAGGGHSLEVTSDGYKDFRGSIKIDLTRSAFTATLSSPGEKDVVAKGTIGRAATIAVDLQSAFAPPAATTATLTLRTAVKVLGAQVYVNGAFKGNAAGARPLAIDLGLGTYDLLVKADGFADYAVKVALDKDMELYADLKATTYALSFSADVRDAEVWIGDRLYGKAPLTIVLPAGTYAYKIKARGYGDYAGTVALARDTRIDAALVASTASISFDVPEAFLFRDEGNPFKNFRVFLDGKLVKDRDLSDIEVAAGSHAVRVVTGGLKFEATLSFEGGKKYRIGLETLLKLTELSGGH